MSALQVRRGFHLTKKERHRVCLRAIDALESMARAHLWIRIYRDHLYRQSRHGRAIERRMQDRKSHAQDEAWRIARMYGVDSIGQWELNHGRVLEWNTPSWNEVPWGIEARARRASARQNWWMFQKREYARLPEHRGHYVEIAERWYQHWKFIDAAVDCLRLKSWPLSDRDIARTKRYIQREYDNEVMCRIRAEVHREEEQAEATKAQRQRNLEVKREAREMVAEIVPGARTRRLMSKAHGFDALVNLLEKSNVDDKTKNAISRLRKAVEGERPATRRLPASAASAASLGDGGRNPQRGDG